ncbi:MAG: undecaprenyl-phosphate glucose phosphotransferase [Dehalococcoidia bacterium]|nr:undecaprenyl-phosphate glucose phosphotransferase [Dehalococcoidia bacterium]
MRQRRIIWLLAGVRLVFDILMVNSSIALAYAIRFNSPLFPVQEVQSWQDYIGFAIIESIVFLVVASSRGIYRFRHNPSRIDELQIVFSAVSIASVTSWAISAFLFRDFAYSRALISVAWLLAVGLVWYAHLIQFWVHAILMRRGIANSRMLIIGTGDLGQAILNQIQGAPEWGYQVLGFIANGTGSYPGQVEGVEILGTVEQVAEVAIRNGVSEIIIAEPYLSSDQIMDIVNRCTKAELSIKVFPDLFRIVSTEPVLSDINGLPMINVRDAALRGWRLSVKRAVDIAFSSMVLVLLSPLLLLVAAVIKITSPDGPVFYVQERIGLDDKPFYVIKFRSMPTDAEVASGPVWAKQGDPRATRLGRFLRRYSIDEFPQFINVLMGDMSIVGPRPERPFFVQQFSQSIPRYLDRHREKAGLTGWAQINGLRGDTNIEERTAYDLWYVENWTLWLDFKIMLRTVAAIFKNSNG